MILRVACRDGSLTERKAARAYAARHGFYYFDGISRSLRTYRFRMPHEWIEPEIDFV